MSAQDLIIAFSEGTVEPLGKYGFVLDLSEQSGCDVLENLLFLVKSMKTPYQVFAGGDRVDPESPDDVSSAYTRLTVWTNDRDNADFLLLMSELGVDVYRPDDEPS